MAAHITLLGQESGHGPAAAPSLQEAVEDASVSLRSQLAAHASLKAGSTGGPSWQVAGPQTALPLTVLKRQYVGGSAPAQVNLGQRFAPGSDLLCSIDEHHSASIFCGKFSGDGTVFATACQDASIRLYETDQLLYAMQVEKERREELVRQGRRASKKRCSGPCPIQPYKVIDARDVGWSIIDSDFSRDKRFVAYTSWSRYIHMASVGTDEEKHESFEVSRPRRNEWHHHFCLFSIKFSDSSDTIAGGANDAHIYVYNLEKREVQNRIHAHVDDINAVIFADQFSSNILLTGSDDALIKLWDLRSPARPRGLLVGHAGGITSLASKGNGFNFLSNSKDQCAKLWDLRVMAEPSDDVIAEAQVLEQPDYRGAHIRRRYAMPPPVPRNRDLSLRTFRGHQVTRTLIRCCFSPQETTGGRYACTGSSDGRILMWDLLSGDESGANNETELSFHAAPVRDLAFHPSLPLMVSSSWDRRLGLWQFGSHSSPE